jgi:hypothetical protein
MARTRPALTITNIDIWGDVSLRRYYGAQAAREARKAARGEGPVYRSATRAERAATASHLGEIANLHYAVAKLL